MSRRSVSRRTIRHGKANSLNYARSMRGGVRL